MGFASRDFPFYKGNPVPLNVKGGLWILAACVSGFSVLLAVPHIMPGAAGEGIGVILFVMLQLVGLKLAVGSAWTAIFHRPTWREVLLAIVCAPLVFGLPALLALFVVGSQHLTRNQVIQATGDLSGIQTVGLFAMSAIQLLGEELVTLLPFLVLLTALRRTALKPWVALGVTWLATSLMFGALHLPTYGWNFTQALLLIGAARLVLTGVYMLTKNVWASTITHIGNDWMLFTVAMLTATHSG